MGLGSIFGKIGKGLLNIGTGGISGTLSDILGGAGAGLGAMSQSGAQNRDAQFSGQMDLASLLQQRELARQSAGVQADNDFFNQSVTRQQAGNSDQSDAWRKLLSAQHTAHPQAMPNITPYAMPRQAPSAATMQGSDALTQEVLARLQGGNQLPQVQRHDTSVQYDPLSTIDPRLLKAGGGEKATGILGAILSGIGGFGRGGTIQQPRA